MKVALIYPTTRVDKKVLADCLPLGVLYLASAIETFHGARVDVFDKRQGRGFPTLRALNDYDLIGFSAMTMQATTALQLARKARKAGFSGRIIFGGPHASVVPDHLKGYAEVDAIFIGEAEDSILQYLYYLGGKPHELRRVWVRENHDWHYYGGQGFIADLDSLPFPAREKYGELPARLRFINMHVSRGCPYQCHFCQPTKHILFGKKVRRRSTSNVMRELEQATDQYCIKRFSIDDDTFTFNKRAVLEFCDAVKPLGLTWSCQSRSDIDRETLRAMHESGCELIVVGVESGSQRMLDLMNKRCTVEQNRQFIKTCNELGIGTWCNMMIGYPGETEADRKMSLQFVRETQPTQTNVSQVTPFPGTYLWENSEDDVINNKWDYIARHVHRAKFKSLASQQTRIKNYITLMNKRWRQPVSADMVNLSGTLGSIAWQVPFLMRVMVHIQHAKHSILEKALKGARRGRTERALWVLKALCVFSSTRERAMGNIAWLYLSTGRPEKAIKYYKALVEKQPDNEEARALLFEATEKSKRLGSK